MNSSGGSYIIIIRISIKIASGGAWACPSKLVRGGMQTKTSVSGEASDNAGRGSDKECFMTLSISIIPVTRHHLIFISQLKGSR